MICLEERSSGTTAMGSSSKFERQRAPNLAPAEALDPKRQPQLSRARIVVWCASSDSFPDQSGTAGWMKEVCGDLVPFILVDAGS